MASEHEVYKICTATEWRLAEERGVFEGSAVDLRDGFIHFSTAAQARETGAKHFANENDLVFVAASVDAMGEALRYEKSRGGALFPHLYAPLHLDYVLWVAALPREGGELVFPSVVPE